MTAYDIDAWLGDTEVTDAQREALVRAADRIAARWPDPDLADTRERALTGAAQIILGDAALDEIGSAYVAARAAEQEAHAALTGALIASEGTASEYDLAERAGVTRVTVRKALGKGV